MLVSLTLSAGSTFGCAHDGLEADADALETGAPSVDPKSLPDGFESESDSKPPTPLIGGTDGGLTDGEFDGQLINAVAMGAATNGPRSSIELWSPPVKVPSSEDGTG